LKVTKSLATRKHKSTEIKPFPTLNNNIIIARASAVNISPIIKRIMPTIWLLAANDWKLIR
jgi:hypothetical protein